ncbi:unnamed protein product [Linum tenue]|uniref:Uncharacterized protein n=1 Tax=Linum tenue TaxID=586396 RepID=A0AAV0PDA6_9ROSI|nr:unnamed protein product [Linum tenue]
MGLAGKLESVNSFSRKKCRSLFWRVRAAVKKAMKSRWGNQHGKKKFQYDPSSYALNFDDSCRRFSSSTAAAVAGNNVNGNSNFTIWVYIVWVEPLSS